MSKLLALAFALAISFVAVTPATAFQSAQMAPVVPAAPAAKGYDDHLVESGTYVNSDGHVVHRPAYTESGRPPEGATAQCRDSTYSFSQHHRGTCSHHGGVARWL